MTPAQQINHFYANLTEHTTISGVISIFPAAVFLSYFVDDAIDDEHALDIELLSGAVSSPFSIAVLAVKKYRWQTAKYRWETCRSAPIGYSADVWDHMHFTRKTHVRSEE